MVTDELLAARAQQGDRASFDELVDRHAERVFRFVFQRLKNRHDAEEATQEAFLKTWTARERYDTRRSFTTWLFTIAYRESVNVIRRRRVTPSIEDASLVAATPAPRRAPDEAEAWQVAAQVLDHETYLALYLRYVADRTPRDIAIILGRTGVWVRVALHRARETIGDTMTSSLHRDEEYRVAAGCATGGRS